VIKESYQIYSWESKRKELAREDMEHGSGKNVEMLA
jgi:hypothetical protein